MPIGGEFLWASICRSIGALICAAVLLANAGPARAEFDLSDLPRELAFPGTSVYLVAESVGTIDFTCGMTDALAWAWLATATRAALLDRLRQPIGSYHSRVAVIPPPAERATWADVHGGMVAAIFEASAAIGGSRKVGERFAVSWRQGGGPIGEARNVIRISERWTVRPSEPCDLSRSGSERVLPFIGKDLFLK